MNLNIQRKLLLCLKQNNRLAGRIVSKFSLRMKLTAVLILIAGLHISARTFPQRITLNVKNASMNSVLQEIRKQSNYKLIYNTDLLSKAELVSLKLNNASVTEALTMVMINQPFKFEIEGETILINPLNELEKRINTEIYQVVITGRVLEENGKPLPGTTVTEKGTKNYVQTDNDGNFSIKASKAGAILVFSYIGYVSRELAGTSSMRVVLSSNNKLDEVIVTGYQQIKKESLTGSVSKIKVADMKVASMGTLDKMLQGQVAGVAIETNSSIFGTAPKIRVRGSASLSGVNEPLWVLDGVPLESPLRIAPSELYSGGARNLLASALSGVNPEDIEDITVLKDATATAMYGTRAVNGVIVITTKRAKKNMPLVINYSTNATVTLKPSINDFNVLNSKDQTLLNEEIFRTYQNALMSFSAETSGAYSKLTYLRNVKALTDEQYRNAILDLKTVNTDWFDYLYKNSFLQQHSLSASYGGKKVYGRISASYYDDLGKTVGESVGRYTVGLTTGIQFTKNLSSEILIKYSHRDQDNPGTQVNPFLYARDAARNMRPYDANGNYEYYKKGYTDFNILKEVDNNYIKLNNNDVLAQIDLKYKIANNLRVIGLFNTRVTKSRVDEIFTESSNYAGQFRQMGTVDPNGLSLALNDRNPRLYKDPSLPLTYPTVSVLPIGGILDRETSTSKFYTGRIQAEWNPLENKNGHSLSVMAGAEAYSNNQKSYFARGYGYSTMDGSINPSPLAIQRLIQGTSLPLDEQRISLDRNLLAGRIDYNLPYKRNTVSYYTNASYNYNEKYVVDFSLRNDAANITLSRFTPTWAAGVAWNLSREAFMEKIENVVSDIKIRASYGLRGNDGSRGPALVAYDGNLTRVYPQFNSSGINISEPENSSLEFEKEHILNAGVDFTLLKKADVSFNVYRRNNFGLIGERQVAPSLGYVTKVFNWANMRNQGVELSINVRPVQLAKDLTFSVVLNAAYNKNTVLSDLTGSKPNIYTISGSGGYALQGGPVTGLYSFKFAGLSADGLAQYYDKDGKIVPAFLATSTDIGNLEYQGSREPKYSGGFTPTFRYKAMSLSAAFVFNAGHVVRLADFYRGGTRTSLYRDDQNTPGDFAYRWTAPGDEIYTVIPRLITDLDADHYTAGGYTNQSIYSTYNNNDTRTVNASYLRFRNINLQYNFSKLAKHLKMQNLSAGLEASNIAIWASDKLKGQDPESLINGLNTPPVKSFTISLNASF
jgi:TonB-linked SusC/RagA family outer membrane protein